MNKYEFYEDYVIGYTKNTNEKFYIDKDIYDKIKFYPWIEDTTGYVAFHRMRLHQFIIGTEVDLDNVETIDHCNRNRKDNRRKNLRFASHKDNIRNGSKRKSNKSGIIGVNKKYESKKGIYYRAVIDVDGITKELCCSYDIDECIVARLQAEKKYYGEFAPQQYLYEQYNIS